MNLFTCDSCGKDIPASQKNKTEFCMECGEAQYSIDDLKNQAINILNSKNDYLDDDLIAEDVRALESENLEIEIIKETVKHANYCMNYRGSKSEKLEKVISEIELIK